MPLLIFLHHEHLFGWAAYYPWRTTPEGIFYSLAKGFSAGLMPGLAQSVLHLQTQSPERFNNYIRLFRSCMEGYRGYAKDALLYGRMMRPLDLAVPQVEFHFNRVPPQRFPAVLNSVWMTQAGETYIVLINHTEASVSTDVALQTGGVWLGDGEPRVVPPGSVRAAVPGLAMRAIRAQARSIRPPRTAKRNIA